MITPHPSPLMRAAGIGCALTGRGGVVDTTPGGSAITYARPDGSSVYRRPDGSSLYLRP